MIWEFASGGPVSIRRFVLIKPPAVAGQSENLFRPMHRLWRTIKPSFRGRLHLGNLALMDSDQDASVADSVHILQNRVQPIEPFNG